MPSYPQLPSPPAPFDFFAAGVLSVRLADTHRRLAEHVDVRCGRVQQATRQWEGPHRATFDDQFALVLSRARTCVTMLRRSEAAVDQEIEQAHARNQQYQVALDTYRADVARYDDEVRRQRQAEAEAEAAASERQDQAA